MITLYLSPAFQMPHKCISLVGLKVYIRGTLLERQFSGFQPLPYRGDYRRGCKVCHVSTDKSTENQGNGGREGNTSTWSSGTGGRRKIQTDRGADK